MAPVARELAETAGVLEPIQTATSVDGQVDELASVLRAEAASPVTVVGFSWGAWLSGLVASRRPRPIENLVLVGCPPLSPAYASEITATRASRLSPPRRDEFRRAIESLDGDGDLEAADAFETLASLTRETDAFDPIAADGDRITPDVERFASVWDEAAAMRESGELLAAFEAIRCPVSVLHGDYDPHPAAGVTEPLDRAGVDYRFELLEDCGHEPWRERRARKPFFDALRRRIDGE